MSASQPPSTQSTTVTQTSNSNTETFTIILQRPPERVIRNQHIVDDTLRVDWTEDVIDNENMNKKKSKKCCIFRKPKDYDESSDESSWEDPDPSDDECDAND